MTAIIKHLRCQVIALLSLPVLLVVHGGCNDDPGAQGADAVTMALDWNQHILAAELNTEGYRGPIAARAYAYIAMAAYEAARVRIAAFVGAADPAEIIYTRNTTESINLVANTWGRANLKPGDLIVLTEMEHHSNLVPWYIIASQTGALIEFIEVTESGELDLENYRRLLERKPKIVAFTHMSNVIGTINPVKEMVRLAHEAASENARRLGLSRRAFLVSAAGAATVLAAVNRAAEAGGMRGGSFAIDGEATLDEQRAEAAVGGDEFIFDVQTHCVEPAGRWAFAVVRLRFSDPDEGILAEKDLEITDFTKPLFWRFRTAAPDRHTYKYEVSLFKSDGTEVKIPEREETREVLVLVPPSA